MKTKMDVLSARQMKQYDKHTIETLGIPAPVLMERAALAVADEVCAYVKTAAVKETAKVLVVSGCGNNGGDGFAIARILTERGMNADILFLGEDNKCSRQTLLQRNILQRLGMDILRNFKEQEYDIIIDAIFGIGLSGEVRGRYAEAVQRINEAKAYKISVDIPSGIDTDSGKILGCAVKADKTVTFGFLKKGLCFYPGRAYAGEIVCADIGITEKGFQGETPDTFTFLGSAGSLLPERSPQGNKGTFGKLLITAGSKDMAGAAILCAKAAYRMGAGMVKIITGEENREIIQQSLPEALLLTYTEDSFEQEEWKEKWKKSVSWADAYVLGCGCGQSEMIREMVTSLLQETGKILVLDADALNLLARNPKLSALANSSGAQKILTPHPGELARLLQTTVEAVTENLCRAAALAAEKYQGVVAGKDAVTAVAAPGEKIYLNHSGNSGMATAGSGDVLAGIIGGLAVQKEAAYEAAWKGVYLHGLAGDRAAEQKGEYAVMASDIVEALPDIIFGGRSWK